MENLTSLGIIDIDVLTEIAKNFFGKNYVRIEHNGLIINWKVLPDPHKTFKQIPDKSTFSENRVPFDFELVEIMVDHYYKKKTKLDYGSVFICGHIYFTPKITA